MPIYNSRYHEPWRGLPGEVRNMIWELSACLPHQIVFYRDDNILHNLLNTTSQRRLATKQTLPTALRCSREAYEIGYLSLLRNNAFMFDAECVDVLSFLQALPKHHLCLMRAIRLSELTVESKIDPSHEKNVSQFIDFMINHMSLQSVTIPIWKRYGRADDAWYERLGAAVYSGRLQELRFVHYDPKIGIPLESSDFLTFRHCRMIVENYNSMVGDKTHEATWMTFRTIASFSDNPTMLKRLDVVKERFDSLLFQHRSFYPFRMGPVKPEDGCCLVVMRYDLDGAKSRLRECMEALADGYDFDQEAEIIAPLKIMRFDERLKNAQESLARYESIMAGPGITI